MKKSNVVQNNLIKFSLRKYRSQAREIYVNWEKMWRLILSLCSFILQISHLSLIIPPHIIVSLRWVSRVVPSAMPNCLRRVLAPNESNIRQFNHFQLIELHPRGIGFSRYLIFCNRTSPRCGPAATHAISIYYRIAIRRIVKLDSRVIYYSRLFRIDSCA